MEKLIEKIKRDTNNSNELIIRKINYNNNYFYLIYNEITSNSEKISTFILKSINKTKNVTDISSYFYNHLSGSNIVKVNNYQDLLYKLLIGYTIILISDHEILAVETKGNLSRSIGEATSEKVIYGPKDSFVENYNLNIGLIRKRIISHDLLVNNVFVGRYTKTKIGICYIKNIANKNLVRAITDRIKKIDIDGIIDSGYIKGFLNFEKVHFFPTIKETERPDTSSQALLEGKIVIVIDNSPFVLILPTFFIDYFHTSDDYYQKAINISFTRIIRVLAFIIAIFIPGYYIAITTHNQNSIPTNLLINFIEQRSIVPYPSLIEALLMIITFEILRESDIRIANVGGTAVSILGGLVLGDALVSAGLISPIMIIVTAISAISGLVFQSVEIITAIRWWRIFLLFLAMFLGIYGLFIGLVLLVVSLASVKNYGIPYLFPFAPFSITGQKDAILKYPSKKIRKRNYLLTNNINRSK